ncbi:Uncharacterized protein F32A5.4 [Toxocara canis]|uniref:Uncharacterized protein F32A5.4 n=1 Tax=Toxocara canis TaxID=6265 RepID=A0A0B2UXK5_TOXCA|nr:Uncharacterized protein F32A5.4 [Toxocara canis]
MLQKKEFSQVRYRIVSGGSDAFRSGPQTGYLYVQNRLTKKSYDVVVQAQDGGGLISERKVEATGPFPISYTIYSGDPDHLFTIERTTGKITVSRCLDADKWGSDLLNIQNGAITYSLVYSEPPCPVTVRPLTGELAVDAGMGSVVNLTVVEQPKAPSICNRTGQISNLFLVAILSTTYGYVDIFKVDNVYYCNVKNGTKLYSGPIYIRHLNAAEQLEEKLYQDALRSWDEASVNFVRHFKENNGTDPENFAWPHVPKSRSFCFGYDVTQYNLTGCVIVDNVAYVHGKKPRHLNDEQIKQLVDYANKLEAYGIYLYENAMQKRGKSTKSVREQKKPTSICDEVQRPTTP